MSLPSQVPPRKPLGQIQIIDKYPTAPRVVRCETTKTTLCSKLHAEQRRYVAQLQNIASLEKVATRNEQSLTGRRLRYARSAIRRTVKRMTLLRQQLDNFENLGV